MHLRYSFQSVSGAISDLNRDILLKPGFIPRARQAAGVSKNALLYSAGVKREKGHHVIDRVAVFGALISAAEIKRTKKAGFEVF